MVGKAKPPTAEERRRMSLIGEQYFGCIPCRLEHGQHVLATVQHVVEGRKRLGHASTYGACEWHHFGHVHVRQPGPSLANGKRTYTARYGCERLLVDLQTALIHWFDSDPWLDFSMPGHQTRKLHALWVTLRADDPYFEG